MAKGFKLKERTEQDVAAGHIVLELDDAMILAVLSLYPNGSDKAFRQVDVLEALKKLGVIQGIETEVIQQAISQLEGSKEPIEQVIVAKGGAPVSGRDAYLDYPAIDAMPKEETDPRDPLEFCRRRIVNILAGQDVAIYHAIEEGTPGIDLHGKTIPIQSAVDSTPKPGRNLAWKDMTLVAEADGRLVIEEKSLYIDEELKIEGDLTPAHGDIDFVGKLIVTGNVEAGVSIRCRKDMEIQGSLIGCDACCECNLRVDCGIIGSDETVVEVHGDLEAGFTENADLKVRGTCRVSDSFVTSSLKCSSAFEMTAGRGHLVSGAASARNGIEVRDVGNPMGTKARLSVGRDDLAKERKEELEAQIENLHKLVGEIQKVDKQVGPMTKAYQKLSAPKRTEVELLLDQLPQMEERLGEAERELEELGPRLIPTYDALVTVGGTVNADTIIEFPSFQLRVPDALVGVTFRFSSSAGKIEATATAA